MRLGYSFFVFAVLCFVLAFITFFWFDSLFPRLRLVWFEYATREPFLAILLILGTVSAILGYMNRR